jgi:hypothetical protein
MDTIHSYCLCLFNQKMAPGALKVALIVGSVLLVINHGEAILSGTMSRNRWLSVGLTYVVPYGVNIHGQWSSSRSQSNVKKS